MKIMFRFFFTAVITAGIITLLVGCDGHPDQNESQINTLLPTAVTGRTITAAQIEDTSDWIEIATYHQCSLIVRVNTIDNSPFTLTVNNEYADSTLRNIINEWYAELATTTRLRQNAVTSDVMDKMGSVYSPDGPLANPNGFSIPQVHTLETLPQMWPLL